MMEIFRKREDGAGMKTTLKLAAAAAMLLAGTGLAIAQTAPKKTATAPAAAKPAAKPAAAKPAAARPAARSMSPALLGGKPNLNGVWQVMPGPNWNLEPHDAAEAPAGSERLGAIAAVTPSLGVVEGGTIPYTAEAAKKRDENRKKAPDWDPEAACYLPGIPRATYMDHPFQIIQADNGDMLIAYQYASANRVIKMGPVGIPPIDTWMGTSYGQWEGNTLKVTTLAQSPGDYIGPKGQVEAGVTWLDRSGNYLTNTTTVVERFTKTDNDHMNYEVTIDDPALYTKAWKISMPLYRRVEKNAQLLDFRCVPFADMLLYGDLLKTKDDVK
jgi:hypothetical protein